jgi:hypothetical protein
MPEDARQLTQNISPSSREPDGKDLLQTVLDCNAKAAELPIGEGGSQARPFAATAATAHAPPKTSTPGTVKTGKSRRTVIPSGAGDSVCAIAPACRGLQRIPPVHKL